MLLIAINIVTRQSRVNCD